MAGRTLLAGSSLTGPLQQYTLFDAFADPVAAANISAAGLDIDELGLAATPIGSIPVVAIGLGSLPIGSIPIGSIDPTDPTAVITAWCDLLAGSPADCDVIGVDPADPATADGVNMLSLSLAAAPIDSIPIGSIPIGSIPIGSIPIGSIPIGSIWVAGTPIGSIRLVATPINSIPIGSIPIGSIPIGSIPIGSIPIDSIELIVDCTVYDCAAGAAAGDTIGDIPAEAWTGTYGQLLQVLTDAGQLAGFTLTDCSTGCPTTPRWPTCSPCSSLPRTTRGRRSTSTPPDWRPSPPTRPPSPTPRRSPSTPVPQPTTSPSPPLCPRAPCTRPARPSSTRRSTRGRPSLWSMATPSPGP